MIKYNILNYLAVKDIRQVKLRRINLMQLYFMYGKSSYMIFSHRHKNPQQTVQIFTTYKFRMHTLTIIMKRS